MHFMILTCDNLTVSLEFIVNKRFVWALARLIVDIERVTVDVGPDPLSQVSEV